MYRFAAADPFTRRAVRLPARRLRLRALAAAAFFFAAFAALRGVALPQTSDRLREPQECFVRWLLDVASGDSPLPCNFLFLPHYPSFRVSIPVRATIF